MSLRSDEHDDAKQMLNEAKQLISEACEILEHAMTERGMEYRRDSRGRYTLNRRDAYPDNEPRARYDY